MEVWIDERRPDVVSTTNVALAVALHVLFFIGVYMFARMHFTPKETVIPIDLTVVVNENLDGVEDEPPPLNDPPPTPPEPPKPPEPTPPPPTPPEPKVVDAVEVVKEKPKPPEKKPPEKPKESLEDRLKRMRESVKEPKPQEKKPEPPKKTKEELLNERMAKMKNSATVKKVNIKVPDAPSGNGRTDKKTLTDKEIRDLLNKGYKPGATTQIAQSEMQFCISRVRGAIDAKWKELQPTIGAEGTVFIAVRFGMNGAMVNCRLNQSCGDRTSDTAALTVVRSVGPISGLDADFLRKYSKEDLIIRYKVESR